MQQHNQVLQQRTRLPWPNSEQSQHSGIQLTIGLGPAPSRLISFQWTWWPLVGQEICSSALLLLVNKTPGVYCYVTWLWHCSAIYRTPCLALLPSSNRETKLSVCSVLYGVCIYIKLKKKLSVAWWDLVNWVEFPNRRTNRGKTSATASQKKTSYL